MFKRYEWLVSLHFPEEYAESPSKCFDMHWEEISNIIENERLRIARCKCDYYDSEGLDDCDLVSEYKAIKAIDDHYIDLWL